MKEKRTPARPRRQRPPKLEVLAYGSDLPRMVFQFFRGVSYQEVPQFQLRQEPGAQAVKVHPFDFQLINTFVTSIVV